MAAAYRLLVVEDEKPIAELLNMACARKGTLCAWPSAAGRLCG